jgi:hypothetical protein
LFAALELGIMNGNSPRQVADARKTLANDLAWLKHALPKQ